MDNQEKDFLDDTEVDTTIRKPKKQLSEQKLQHLQNIRVKAHLQNIRVKAGSKCFNPYILRWYTS